MSFPEFAAAYDNVDEDPEEMPWEEHDWIPKTNAGKQKTPNQIRGALQRYIDASGETQTAIVSRMGVSYSSFSKFMNPKTYKDQWSAVQNGTYWAAARLLAQHDYEKKFAKKPPAAAGSKRKAMEDVSNTATTATTQEGALSKKKSKTELKLDAERLIEQISNVEGASPVVYDSCPEVAKHIREFLQIEGVTKASFCRAIDVNHSSSVLNNFLLAKKQDGAGSSVYPAAYLFFEKKRILENLKKTKTRLKNETEHPTGFSLQRPSRHGWYLVSTSNFY